MALKVLSRTKFKHNIWLQIFENYEVQASVSRQNAPKVIWNSW